MFFNVYIMSLLKLLHGGHWTSPSRRRNIINMINHRTLYLANLN